jgi:hypothetical protein
MKGQVVMAVLSEAYREFGPPTPETHEAIASWVQRRVRQILAGDVAAAPEPLRLVSSRQEEPWWQL